MKKGDLVCELDSAPLRDQLPNQKIATQAAEAAYQKARLTREVAEIAVKEYEEGVYPQDMQTIQGEIKMAELGLKKTEARLERTRRARQKLNDMIGRKERPRGILRHPGRTGTGRWVKTSIQPWSSSTRTRRASVRA